MLLFAKNITDDLRFAAWHISEGEAFFRDDLPLSTDETAEVLKHQDPMRTKEWLASRWLLHQLTGAEQRMPLAKDAYSKPFFVAHAAQHYCSLSHSKGTVAALISPYDCGCDIQVLVDKLPRIAPKFMRTDEFEWIAPYPEQVQFLLKHFFWTSKEAMYKAYGKKEVDFKAHLFITPFEWRENDTITTTGYLQKNEEVVHFQLYLGMYNTELEDAPSFMWTVAVMID